MNRDDLFIVIPSRIGSTRLKNKPLVNIKGKTLIQRVVINALEITENVYVATDSVLVKDNLKEITNNVVITKPEHISGTDRVYEAAKKLNLNKNSFILNLQGDEPFIPSKLIKMLQLCPDIGSFFFTLTFIISSPARALLAVLSSSICHPNGLTNIGANTEAISFAVNLLLDTCSGPNNRVMNFIIYAKTV